MGVLETMPKGVRTVLETAVTLAVALAIAWLAQAFVVKPYRVPTPSMVPTLLPGDRVLADRLSLDFGDPHRYQIVVFHPPHCTAGNSDGMGVCTSPDLGPSRRPGRHDLHQARHRPPRRDRVVAGREDLGAGSRASRSSAWTSRTSTTTRRSRGARSSEVQIPKGYYLLMGDNRGISDDSRDWGLEPRDGIIGVARARYWPIRRIGTL